MRYPYKKFIFENYSFENNTAKFEYSFDDVLKFKEEIEFKFDGNTDNLDNALNLAFFVLGTSYYKCFPVADYELRTGTIDKNTADFLNLVYSEGLGEFIYKNQLDPQDLIKFIPNKVSILPDINADNSGMLLMQSGGKDSLLAKSLIEEKSLEFDQLYVSIGGLVPGILKAEDRLKIIDRRLDTRSIETAKSKGALNGHVPFSAILLCLSLIAAKILGKEYILASNEWSANEPNTHYNGLPINHQFSKSYNFELAASKVIGDSVSKKIKYGSVLRPFSDLKVAELFAKKCWDSYKDRFSSCNVANYHQNQESEKLKWCGRCPKCASTFLLMAPFVDSGELINVFGANLLSLSELDETYKELLGLANIKPFECVGEIEEMRQAYKMAVQKDTVFKNDNISLPETNFNYKIQHDHQEFIEQFIDLRDL